MSTKEWPPKTREAALRMLQDAGISGAELEGLFGVPVARVLDDEVIDVATCRCQPYGDPVGPRDDIVFRRIRRSTLARLEFVLADEIPLTVECVALVRGPRPRGVWAWLWDVCGLWLAHKAGFAAVWPGGWKETA